jgi:hypothetical protein
MDYLRSLVKLILIKPTSTAKTAQTSYEAQAEYVISFHSSVLHEAQEFDCTIFNCFVHN